MWKAPSKSVETPVAITLPFQMATFTPIKGSFVFLSTTTPDTIVLPSSAWLAKAGSAISNISNILPILLTKVVV